MAANAKKNIAIDVSNSIASPLVASSRAGRYHRLSRHGPQLSSGYPLLTKRCSPPRVYFPHRRLKLLPPHRRVELGLQRLGRPSIYHLWALRVHIVDAGCGVNQVVMCAERVPDHLLEKLSRQVIQVVV